MKFELIDIDFEPMTLDSVFPDLSGGKTIEEMTTEIEASEKALFEKWQNEQPAWFRHLNKQRKILTDTLRKQQSNKIS